MYNYSLLPSQIRHGVQDYVENGNHVGGFLTAVITNDLKNAFGRADEVNRERLFDIVAFFHNEAPGPCWGNPDKMQTWMAHHGLAGYNAAVASS
jgi:hypothetical protein